MSRSEVDDHNQENHSTDGDRIQTLPTFFRAWGCGYRGFNGFRNTAQPFVIGDGLLWVQTDFLSVCPDEAAVEDASRQEMEFFSFDGEKETSTDASLRRNLSEGDPFGFPGFFESGTKVGHFFSGTAENHMDTTLWGQLLLYRVFATVRAGFPAAKYERCVRHG